MTDRPDTPASTGVTVQEATPPPEVHDTDETGLDASHQRIPWWRRVGAVLVTDQAIAVLTWLIATPLAVLLARAADLDPFSVGGVVMPVGVGAIAAAVVFALVLRRYSARLIGVGMGLYASWIALTMAVALHGTPYGYGLLVGDQGRFVAMAMKYMTTWVSTDSYVKGIPTEYPPLYPWMVGHLATLVHRPAWQLFGETQIVVMSGAMIAGYIMWRRLVSPAVAFAVVGLAPAVFNQPSKDYEFLALIIFIPWVIATFAGPRPFRGSLHWLPAGAIGGLIVLTYQAWLLYSAIGLLALIALTFRAMWGERLTYLLHLVGVAATALVVASWYVIPFAWMLLTHGGERVSDLWMSPGISDRPLVLPFMQMTPIAIVQLVGLLGMVWYRRTTIWATPIILIVASNYLYRALFLIKTAQDNHTGYLQYTETLISMALLVAGVLTTAEAVPALRTRLSTVLSGKDAVQAITSRERAVAVTGVVAIVAWAAMQGWVNWVPGPRGLRDSVSPPGLVNRGTDAHAERLPDGTLTRFAPPAKYVYSLFPTTAIDRVVSSQLGANATPIVLSDDQRLFAFLPWYGYTAVDRLSANTLLKWDDRAAEITRLSKIQDPQAFAQAAGHTAFGPIDVFVLRGNGDRWMWKSTAFDPASFDPAHFHVQKLPGNVIVAVRKS